MKTPTIKDVAKRAEVGIATVSRVIHAKDTVNAELRGRVLRAMEDLQFTPNPSAQAMRSQSTRIIACAIRNITVPEIAFFVDEAQKTIQAAGYTLILTNTGDQPAQEAKLLSVLARRKVDGLLMTKTSEEDPGLEAVLAELNLPVVLIDREVSGNADAVVIDHQRGMKAAVDHLVSLGHRQIALMTGQTSVRPGRERVAGYKAALQAHGIPVDESLISARSFRSEDGFREASLMLSGRKPTAIISGGMNLLPGVLRAIQLLGLRIAEDISVIAGSDSDLSELTVPAITAVRWDSRAWGRISAELLLRRLAADNKVQGRQVILPTELVIRQSCAPVAANRVPPTKTKSRPGRALISG